jgi:hypothetical protein
MVDQLTCVKISKSKQASICPHAQDLNHPCVYALCTQCKLMMDLVAMGQKKEVWEKDGVWVVDDIEENSMNRPIKCQRNRQQRDFLAPGEHMVGNMVVAHGIL